MTTLSTPEELNALPHSAIVTDAQGCAWMKFNIPEQPDGPGADVLWALFGSHTVHTTAHMSVWGPFELLAEGPFLTPKKLFNAVILGG